MNYESMLLGQILQDNEIYYKGNVRAVHFSSGKNKRVFSAIVDCLTKGIVADIQSVFSVDGNIDAGYLSQLTSSAPSTANWEFYFQQTVEESRKESLSKIPFIITDLLKTNDSKSIIEELEKYLAEIATENERRGIKKISSILPDVIENIEKRYHDKGTLPGLCTGMSYLDDIFLGFRPRMLYYIGGRPSDGKSALMMNIAGYMAVHKKTPVGIISGESGNQELVERVISGEGNVNSQKLASGLLGSADFSRIHDIAEKMYGSPLYFYDMPNPELVDVISQARRMVAVHGVKIIFIDYLQLIQYGSPKQQRAERIGMCSLSLKALARDLNIPIVCLAQLRRDADNRRPQKGDFSDSSQIEKDADGIILIYHKQKDEEVKSSLLIEKNRDGRTGLVRVTFKKDYVKFCELVKEYQDDNN